ncbi:MAG: secretory lipase family protein [Bradyrhizobium sp.]|nr:secretory lipase family protein [Bradyrhizobium sp.]
MKKLAAVLALTSVATLNASPSIANGPDERFGDGGVSPFYSWSKSMPEPGKLLREESLKKNLLLAEASRGVRILYSSTDGMGGSDRIAVSGAYFVPRGKPPRGGWPLVAWAHGTVGMGDVCAPSWAGRSDRDVRYLNSWLSQGFAVVATDYQGLGTPGPHAYMETRPEAYSVLDSIKAVLASQPNLSKKVVIVGQSQGASAAFATAGFAPAYAPKLDIRGIVATGLPYVSYKTPEATSLKDNQDRVDPTIAYTYYLMLTVQQTRPEIAASVVYTDKALPLLDVARTMCIKPLENAVVAAGLTRNNAMNAIKPGVTARVFGPLLPTLVYPTLKLRMPVFVGTGAADKDVAPRGQLQLVREACEAGTLVEAHLYEGLDHSGTVNASLRDSLPFVRKALLGQRIAPRCSPEAESTGLAK